VSATRLIGFEAAAIRRAHDLNDEDLAGELADLVDRAATDDGAMRAQDLRELGAAAIVTARRMSEAS